MRHERVDSCKMRTVDDKVIAIIDRMQNFFFFFFSSFVWGIRSGSAARCAQRVRRKKGKRNVVQDTQGKKKKQEGRKKKNMTVKTKSGTSLITRVLRLEVVNNLNGSIDWFFFFCFLLFFSLFFFFFFFFLRLHPLERKGQSCCTNAKVIAVCKEVMDPTVNEKGHHAKTED